MMEKKRKWVLLKRTHSKKCIFPESNKYRENQHAGGLLRFHEWLWHAHYVQGFTLFFWGDTLGGAYEELIETKLIYRLFSLGNSMRP